MKRLRRALALLLTGALLTGAALAGPAGDAGIDAARRETQAYLLETVTAPQPGQVGGEWVVFALARLGADVPEGYYDGYYRALETLLRKERGILDARKYSEYSRTVLALTALGRDPADVGGYDLLSPLGDYDQTVWQGIMGPVMALLALDSGSYEIPPAAAGKTQASRALYLDYILSRQLPDGGFALTGASADVDVTAMAVQALANYQDREGVPAAVEGALNCLSGLQDGTGGFESWGLTNVESTAQVIIALCELNLPLSDRRFVKDGHTLADALLSYCCSGGGFSHMPGGETDAMATEQALLALAALARQADGKPSLYTVTDAAPAQGLAQAGLPGKDGRVKLIPVTLPGKTFPDIQGHVNQSSIEALAARQILDGKNGGLFDPEGAMTRAEFAAILVRALGLEPEITDVFTDVPADEWYAGTIGAAFAAGLIEGVGAQRFDPSGTVTRQQAAVLLARAAGLCGLDNAMSDTAVRSMLSQFPDAPEAAQWAREGLALCYDAGILDERDWTIRPQDKALRCEVAEMVWRLLECAALTG